MSLIKFQRTIGDKTSCVGIGLHTGVESKITFKPAPDNFGIRFKRMDVEGCPEIRADIDHVVDISRGTTIEENDVRIHTVEHALAAVSGLRIDNILIELTGKEPPVMDGSAKDFVECLIKAGIKLQTKKRKVLEITRAINYTNPYRDIDIHVIPSDRFRITFMVEYPLPALGTQYEAIYNMEEDFAFEVAPARTFCFLSEVEMLKERGLIKGGALDNAVVIIDKEIDQSEMERLKELFGIEDNIIQGANGILNGKVLRFKNEPVRHKTLDLIGDLALLGVPIKGHVTAARAGHASNVEFVKKLKKQYTKELNELWSETSDE
jgi:UDP-3-O-[3-hydroxymyristoyl] N-acetylglucosamine deacetylase/3-hydroxyacyl-[acyl-carrier-protein] dehydratase